jgi:hypothetical protein
MLNFLQQHDCHLPFQPFRVSVEDRAVSGQGRATKAAV